MPLNKQPVQINFSQGVDTKTDPFQVQLGKFLRLKNSVFDKTGRLTKRNGFENLVHLPDSSSTTLATAKNTLLAFGRSLQSYSPDSNKWINKGPLEPLELSVLSAVRTARSQTSCDIAIADNGLACAVFLDSAGNYFYQIFDSETGEINVSVTAISGTISSPRVFALGSYFVIAFIRDVAGVIHLSYFAIPTNIPDSPSATVDVTNAVSAIGGAWDGVVANNNLYFGWNGNDGGGAVRFTWIDSTLVQHGTSVFAAENANLISLSADFSVNSPVIWASYYNAATQSKAILMDGDLQTILAPTLILGATAIPMIASSATDGVMTYFYQLQTVYAVGGARTDSINWITVNSVGTVSGSTVLMRGMGIASKSYFHEDLQRHFILGVYAGAFQPTYFLLDLQGHILCKLAYSNASGYAATQVIPSINASGNGLSIGYLIRTLLTPVNKSQGSTAVPGFYAQTGVNLAKFLIGTNELTYAEIANVIHISGGYLWMYDGVKPVEHGFHVWPEDAGFTTSSASGGLTKQIYFYYFVYEWTDAQGNIHRSAPSVPLKIDLTASATATNNNTLYFPSLRATYKTGNNPVRIVIYRWSGGQPIPYQITSVSSPIINNPAVDQQNYNDAAADSAILGNNILYTFGGIIENIGAPACSVVTLYKSRLVLLPSEDTDNLWYSKQVIQGVPVETSNLLTIFTPPTISAQGSTGRTYCLFEMDDKLCFWKRTSIYYTTGKGPDNTGANNDFSDPILITTTVGSDNQQSLVLIPSGVMFQSDTKGIWLLGRNLSTQYIGADVQDFNNQVVESSVDVPDSNEIRFHLNNGMTLMYDYYQNQWSEFFNVSGISSVIFQNLHTYMMPNGQVRIETPDKYLDGGAAVLMGFTSSWIKLTGLLGYQRAYFFYLLATYKSAHRLLLQVAYDYNEYPSQQSSVIPVNSGTLYGSDAYYGSSSPYGGVGNLEKFRVYLTRQKCESIQITLDEINDPSVNPNPGEGLTLSGINMIIGIKSSYPRLRTGAQTNVGANN